MAKAKVTTEKIVIHLEISGDEANAMADLFRRVGGCPTHSRRKHVDAVRAALDNIGYDGKTQEDIKTPASIYFHDDPGNV